MAGTNKLQQSPIGGPCVILVEPQLGENIGFTARAMMNGGLSDLRIVKPRDGWPNPRAAAAASGADGVIETARIFERTEEAISDLQRVYAMTARPREIDELAGPRRDLGLHHDDRATQIGSARSAAPARDLPPLPQHSCHDYVRVQ